MMEIEADVAVIGAGFGGSLMALILSRIGLRPVLIERGTHPRFAIGESSTPLADLVLETLATRYSLPRLLPLANYGSWQQTYPELACGLKRGFSYFRHQPGRSFAPRDDHENELLVAASAGEADADMHWYRADFDHFLLQEAERAGVPYFDKTQISEITPGTYWTLRGERDQQAVRFKAAFVIDASGEGNLLARRLGIPSGPEGMRTHSRGLYAHFRGVKPWRDMLLARGGRVDEHPFCSDDSALHHVVDEGWMWVLRFNNGITSAGFALDEAAHPLDSSISAAAEWKRLMDRYPSIAEQFADATIVDPGNSLRRTPRMQRRTSQAAGTGWAQLPSTAGFIDPLFSTGNAHTLWGIERLAGILERHWNRPELRDALTAYSADVVSELGLLDQMVHGCYAGFQQFELMAQFSMLYFAAATVAEDRRRCGRHRWGEAFLRAGDPEFRLVVDGTYERLLECLKQGPVAGQGVGVGVVSKENISRFEQHVRENLAPFNIAGLCDKNKHNMYGYQPCGT